jgi:alkylhydroperoxidase family enzyme
MSRIEPVPWDDLPEVVRTHVSEGRARGKVTGDTAHVYAHSPYVALAHCANDNAPRWQGMIDARLNELMRLRSAQVNGCAPCSQARKEPDSVSEEDVACLIDPAHLGLPRREELAIRVVDLMATDHHAIDDAMFLELSGEFSTEEIVELLYRAGHMVGAHRFVHVLDVLGESTPVIAYDPEVLRESWERAYGAVSEPATS